MSKLGLVDFLIKPVKRIPQYELLLNQIKKHLNKGSKAHQTVRTAKLIIRELATWINEKKKNVRRHQFFLFRGPQFVAYSRQIIHI